MTGWTIALILAVAAAAIVGVIVGFALGRRGAAATHPPAPDSDADEWSSLDGGLVELVEAMNVAMVIAEPYGAVRMANGEARQLGLVSDGRLSTGGLLDVVKGVCPGESVQTDLHLPPLPGRRGGITVRVHGTALTDGRVGLVIIDVSDEHRVEAVRRDFVANVSHELKTPIGAITLLGEAIEDAADDQDAVRRFALSMQKESKRLTTLITELIELSRLQGGEAQPPDSIVRIGEIVAESLDRVRLAAKAKQVRILSDGDDTLAVQGIAPQLTTAVTNLLTNAVSYSPDSTTVAVTYRRRGDDAEVVVKDQGIGISPPDIERIFERFFRVDRARSRATGGTGLGLAIVKHIATNHGGSVRVWSKEGAGSTFTLSIPIDRSTGEVVEPASPDHSVVSDTSLADSEPAR